MKPAFRALLLISGLLLCDFASAKTTVKALYIPLADHYAAVLAYERYRDQMQHADFQIQQMPNWKLLRAYFSNGHADMAFVMSPLAMDMFQKQPNFRWIGLLHRDGNALAINSELNKYITLSPGRRQRQADASIANVLLAAHKARGIPTEIALPHPLSTHAVVLYRYLKQHGLTMGRKPSKTNQVMALSVAPAESLVYLKGKASLAEPAAFEQSLPWSDIVETQGYGRVAWYSKDVMRWPGGHVECIAIASDHAIATKQQAIKEVMYYIHQAGADIEHARREGGTAMLEIMQIIQKYMPKHGQNAVMASLSPELNVINYNNLNIDKAGLRQIMDYAVEGGILKQVIDIDQFADERFRINLLGTAGD